MEKDKSQKILGLKVTGGFLDGLDISFSEHLNCIIGARGTGKTTLLEFLRYALSALPQDDFARRRVEGLVAANLGGGTLQIRTRTKDGLPCSISRAAGEDPILVNGENRATGAQFNSSMIRADIFSQNEIEDIAGRPAAQLALIDTFAQDDIAALESEMGMLRQKLEQNINAACPLAARAAELESTLHLRQGIEDRLVELAEDSDNREAVDRAQRQRDLRSQEDGFAGAVLGALQNIPRHINAVLNLLSEPPAQYSAGLEDSDNGDLMDGFADICATLQESLSSAFERIHENLEECSARVSLMRQELRTRHQQADIDFRELLEQEKQEREKIDERLRLMRERETLMERERELKALRQRMTALDQEHKGINGKLSDLYDRRFAIRDAIVERLNKELSPNIRITLEQFGGRMQMQGFLDERLKKPVVNHRHVASILARHFTPSELASVVRSGSRQDIARLPGLGEVIAGQVISALGADGVLAFLESVPLNDSVSIALEDHGKYKTSSTLSTGQKCNTILPILLLDGDRPLIIDQPEDNLDNRYVQSTIVDSVRKVKANRQLIFVTHNPNIPVLGDAENIIVLDSRGSESNVKVSGSVDECRDDIVNILEGGLEAFRERSKRYALEGK